MKLARLGERGSEIPVVLTDDGRYLDLRPLVSDVGGSALGRASLQRVRENLELLPVLASADWMRVGAPIARPGAVYCIGMNYSAHAAESGSLPPEVPIMFLKPSNTVVGPYDTVDIPRRSTKTDWEVELGVVIGDTALYLESPADAHRHIAGYVAANDVSEREFQLEISGGQWSKGKSAPGFTPLGPWLATADEVDSTSLQLMSWVNGEPRQNSSTRDLIFAVDYLVWNLSQYLQLDPGDVILTGTPEGVALSGRFPYLVAGDVVEVEVTGLGRQRQEFAQA